MSLSRVRKPASCAQHAPACLLHTQLALCCPSTTQHVYSMTRFPKNAYVVGRHDHGLSSAYLTVQDGRTIVRTFSCLVFVGSCMTAKHVILKVCLCVWASAGNVCEAGSNFTTCAMFYVQELSALSLRLPFVPTLCALPAFEPMSRYLRSRSIVANMSVRLSVCRDADVLVGAAGAESHTQPSAQRSIFQVCACHGVSQTIHVKPTAHLKPFMSRRPGRKGAVLK